MATKRKHATHHRRKTASKSASMLNGNGKRKKSATHKRKHARKSLHARLFGEEY